MVIYYYILYTLTLYRNYTLQEKLITRDTILFYSFYFRLRGTYDTNEIDVRLETMVED